MKRVIACIDSSPCINALAEAAAWIAKQTGRELVLLQVLDYYPASYHLGEISGVIGFESNAMLLKELAELEQKQSENIFKSQTANKIILRFVSSYNRNVRTVLYQYHGKGANRQRKGELEIIRRTIPTPRSGQCRKCSLHQRQALTHDQLSNDNNPTR